MRPAQRPQPTRPSRIDRRGEYDVWAPVYPPVAHNPVMRAEQAVVEPLLRRLAPRRALDVGTGSGRYLEILASTGAMACGIDFSGGMLSRIPGSQGRTGGPEGPRCRVCGDARALPIQSRSVDLVNASLMVGDIADLTSWAREMARVLVAGGHLVYSDFHPNWERFGWRRTFRGANGVLYDVPFEPHALQDHRGSLAEAGFAVHALDEVRLVDHGDREVRAFQSQWGDLAVVVVLHAIRR
jgi:malonyl-CoA O-methyltransferase